MNVNYPREVGRIIRRCLEKEPARRLQSSLDLRNELEDVRNELTSGGPALLSVGSVQSHIAGAAVERAGFGRLPSSESRRPLEWRRPRRTIPMWAIVAAVILLLGGGGYWLAVRDRTSDLAPVSASPATIAAFENRTGDGALNFVGQMLADAITQELPQLLLLQQAPTSGPRAATTAARRRVVVSGSYYLIGDVLRVQASVSDPTGALLHSIEPQPARERTPHASSSWHRTACWARSRRSRIPADPTGGLSRPPLYSAYREMLPGYALYGTDNAGAVKHFTRAAELDPNAFAAWEMLAYVHGDMGNREAQRETIDRIAQLRDRLTPFEQARFSVVIHLSNNRPIDALQALREAEKIAPQDLAINYQIGQAELRRNRPQATIAQYAKVQADAWNSSILGGWRHSRLTTANHLLGQHEEELRIARDAMQLFPTQLGTRNDELFALAALGRSMRLAAPSTDIVALQYASTGSPGGSMRITAEELRAHGYREQALAVARRGVAWYRNRPPAQLETLQLALAQTLYEAEEWESAQGVVTELLKRTRRRWPQSASRVRLRRGCTTARLP